METKAKKLFLVHENRRQFIDEIKSHLIDTKFDVKSFH